MTSKLYGLESPLEVSIYLVTFLSGRSGSPKHPVSCCHHLKTVIVLFVFVHSVGNVSKCSAPDTLALAKRSVELCMGNKEPCCQQTLYCDHLRFCILLEDPVAQVVLVVL